MTRRKLPIPTVMKNNMKAIGKILFVLVLFSALLTSFASCGDRKYDEGEVIAAADRLIRKSAVIEDILYGKGFDLSLSGDSGVGYKRVDPNSVKYYADLMGESFTDLAGLRAVISNVYTAGYASDIFSLVLSGSINTDTRYYQNGSDIMASQTYKQKKKDEIAYHYETLRVDGVDGEKITVAIDITITTKEGKSQRRTIKVDMLEEASGWRLDTSTFAVYNENYESYKDLENQLNKK